MHQLDDKLAKKGIDVVCVCGDLPDCQIAWFDDQVYRDTKQSEADGDADGEGNAKADDDNRPKATRRAARVPEGRMAANMQVKAQRKAVAGLEAAQSSLSFRCETQGASARAAATFWARTTR